MNNAWSEMVSSTPCLALYSSRSPRLLQTIWDNSAPITDQPCRLITTLLLLVLHVYDYEQPNAPFPTLFSSGTIAYTTLPNTRMCATQGRLPLHISSGVTDVKAFVGHRFSV